MTDPLHAPTSGEVLASCEESPADTLSKESGATFSKRSVFSSMVAFMFDEGVRVTAGILCSEETGAPTGEVAVNVKPGVVSLDRDVTGTDVTDPKSPKFIFAELVFGTGGDTLLGIVKETPSGKYGLLSPEACVEVSITTGSICEVNATLVSVAPLDAATVATVGKELEKEEVTTAVSLADGRFFIKSSVRPRTIQLHFKPHSHQLPCIILFYKMSIRELYNFNVPLLRDNLR
jgi:hypothetical protein